MRLSRNGSGRSAFWIRILPPLAALLGAGASLLVIGSPVPSKGKETAQPTPVLGPSAARLPAPAQRLQIYAGLPMIFEPNRGQSDPQVKFLARGSGYGLFLTGSEAVLLLQHSKSQASRELEVSRSVVRMKLAQSSRDVQVEGLDLLPGRSNYLMGNDPAKWRRGIPQYAKVRYRGVYPGIDLIYYGRQGELEYDFQVQPGADPGGVHLRFEGARGLELNERGDLLIRAGAGEVRLEAPQAYQTVDAKRKNVSTGFRLLAADTVGFEIGDYDRRRVLVIDPVLSYSLYLGGSKTESFPTIAVDTAFNFYVTGATTSTDFPVASPLQGTLNGAQNVFVTKFSPGSGVSAQPTVVYSTYLGGSGTDSSVGIGVDAGFNAYLAGTTSSPNFPVSTTVPPLQSTPTAPGTHAFVSELNSAGSSLPYSTYLSGSGTDTASGMALDNKGLVYVIGITNSKDFPVAPNPGAYQISLVGPIAFFVSQINPTNSGPNSLLYSTYFGGGFPSTATVTGGAVAVDNNPAGSNIYFTGGTNFINTLTNPTTDFPITSAFQPCLDEPQAVGNCGLTETALDAFVAKIAPPYPTTNNQGNQLRYSTYLGGSQDDIGYAIGVDAAGNAYVGGSTTSNDFFYSPVILPYQKQNNGGMDGFVAKVSNPQAGGTNTLVGLTYFSYLGGSGTDYVRALAVDSIQGARVTGSTNSTDFPVAPSPGALQPTLAGTNNAFVARLDTTATTSSAPGGIFATYLGGSGIDFGTGIAIDSNGSTYVTGETTSTNFNGAVNSPPAPPGPHAFISKLGPNLSLTTVGCVNLAATSSSPCPDAPPNVSAGNQVAFIYTITNTGDATSGVAFVDNLSSAGVTSTFVSATATGGSCPTIPTNNQLICSIGTINGGQMATVTVNLTPTTGPGNIGNSGQVIVAGSAYSQTASATAAVNTFTEAISPSSFTVTAGQPATYTITVSPQTVFTASVALACSQGLPPGSTVGCVFSLNPILLPNASSQAVTLTINTTVRTTTTVELRRFAPLYAALVPMGGLVFLGVGLGGVSSRRRSMLLLMGILMVVGLAGLQLACHGSSSSNNTVGTPAGTYTVQITATSGTYSQTVPVTLVVQ